MRASPLTKLSLGSGLVVACVVACSATSTSHDDPGAASSSGGPAPAPASNAPAGGSTGAPKSGADSGAAADDETPIPYVAFDINHVVSTGQSNSVAHGGIPPISLTQPFSNLMFDVGVLTSGTCEGQGCRVYQKPSSFVPLVEGDIFWWPVETMSSGLANEATKLARTKYGKTTHDVLISLAGRNGLTYWCLRKGTCNYVDPAYIVAFEETLMQVADAKALAAAQGKSYVVRVVTSIHGESDDYGYATDHQEFPLDGTDGTFRSIKSYTDGLIEWQRDYETAIKEITGQTQALPLLISQFSGWNDIATSAVTQLQYDAHVTTKGKVVIVAPGYILDWGPDCRHYSSNGERQLGEYFGKAYARIVFEGLRWEPVHPKTVTLARNVITAKYYVPVPPLVLDTQRVVDPGNYGFEVVDAASNPVAITSVVVSGPDEVKITLAAPPSGAVRLRYAFTTVPKTCPGHATGARGNLRDSDTSPSNYGYELFNWSVHFETPIN